MPHRKVTFERWQIVAAFLLVVAAFVVQGVFLKETINDVNRDRLVSCKHTYEGVREALKPLFPSLAKRTLKQKRDIDTFNLTVDRLKNRCSIQVNGGKP